MYGADWKCCRILLIRNVFVCYFKDIGINPVESRELKPHFAERGNGYNKERHATNVNGSNVREVCPVHSRVGRSGQDQPGFSTVCPCNCLMGGCHLQGWSCMPVIRKGKTESKESKFTLTKRDIRWQPSKKISFFNNDNKIHKWPLLPTSGSSMEYEPSLECMNQLWRDSRGMGKIQHQVSS